MHGCRAWSSFVVIIRARRSGRYSCRSTGSYFPFKSSRTDFSHKGTPTRWAARPIMCAPTGADKKTKNIVANCLIEKLGCLTVK